MKTGAECIAEFLNNGKRGRVLARTQGAELVIMDAGSWERKQLLYTYFLDQPCRYEEE